MRNFKRFLALMLTVLMVAGCFAIPTSAAASDRFDDVDTYVEAIDTLAAIGVVTGTSETTFNTDADVLRFQAALLFAKALTGKTDGNVWKTGVNNSVFADLDENPQDLFVNAISYVNNNGIVTGKSATKFAPRDGITFEQGLTMAVRALGYETAAMKASATTGLWMYIDKAISLGLDAGLEDITDYKATLTRGQMAQLIYNMLFVETADGYTYAAKAFNLMTETFILTSTNTTKYDIGDDGIVLAATGYVGLTTLAADGSLGKTYYFKASTLKDLLGADSDNFDDAVGYSYNVIADDTLNTIYSIEQNTVKTFENTLDDTTFTINALDGALTVDNDGYELKEKYTGKLWNNGVKNVANGTNEVLFYDWSENQAAKEGAYYYYDVNGNIVSKDGTILMYLVANGGFTTSIAKTYMVKDETTGTYRLPTATDWANATYYQTTATGQNYYKQYTTNADLKGFANVSLFGEIKAIDDNGDGKFDRMFYTQYKFGQYTEYTSANQVYVNVTGANGEEYVKGILKSSITFKGETVKSGDYIVFAANTSLKEIIVKNVIAAKTGYVNGFNTTGSITIDGGTPLAIGSGLNLAGIISVANVLGTNGMYKGADLVGKYVQYYQIDKTVVAFSANDASTFVVYDGVVTAAADNSIMVKVYFPGKAGAELIPVTSLNGYPLSQYVLNGTSLSYVYTALLNKKDGELMTAAKDANGNYHLYEIQTKNNNVVKYANKVITGNVEVAGEVEYQGLTKDTANAYYFKNGVAYAGNNATEVKSVNAKYQANDSTLFVFVDGTDILGTFAGKPVDGSYIEFMQTGHVVYQYNNPTNKVASIVYVYGATKLYGSFSTNAYDKIIYVDSATVAAQITTTTYNGTEWTYTNVVDVTNGKYDTVKAASTNIGAYGLSRNSFYYVKNGYVVAEAADNDIVAIKLESIGLTLGALGTATITDQDGKTVELENLTAILNWANGKNSTIEKNAAGAIVNYLTADMSAKIAAEDAYLSATMIKYDIAGKQAYAIILDDNKVDSKQADYEAKVTEKYTKFFTVEEGKGIKVSAEATGTTGTMMFSSNGADVDSESVYVNTTLIPNGKTIIGDTVAKWAGKSFTISGTPGVTVTVYVREQASSGMAAIVPVATYKIP